MIEFYNFQKLNLATFVWCLKTLNAIPISLSWKLIILLLSINRRWEKIGTPVRCALGAKSILWWRSKVTTVASPPMWWTCFIWTRRVFRYLKDFMSSIWSKKWKIWNFWNNSAKKLIATSKFCQTSQNPGDAHDRDEDATSPTTMSKSPVTIQKSSTL